MSRREPCAPGPAARTADATHDSRLSIVGEGPPFVYVPGMDGTGLLFYRQIPSLAGAYRIATYTLRDVATHMAELVDDLEAVVTELSPGGGPVTVFGESFGGALSLSFALARPELVERLIVLNTFPYFTPQLRLRLAIGWIRTFPWRTMALVRRLTASRMHSRYTHRDELRKFLELTAGTTRLGYLNRLRILKEYDVRDRLGKLRAPTLLLAADRDHLVPSVEQAQYMAARIPDSTLQVLEGHGHGCLLAPNLDLLSILNGWLEQRTQADRGGRP
ncbi:MAG: alpha/beta fold hydrolase [Gemmatimonadota bacterium]|nr:MAG: alpha/beta fold hydrolase [Gemmatimonadota bacterium]